MRYTIIILSVILLSVPSVIAQAPGGGSPEFTVDPSDSVLVNEKSVIDSINNFLDQKGWSGGVNYKSDGSRFFIATGTGVIEANRSSSSYISSRVIAFDKAMLVAKQAMAEFVGVEIQKGMIREYTENTGSSKKNQGSEELVTPQQNSVGPTNYSFEEDDLLKHGKKLLHDKANELLAAKGVLPGGANYNEEVNNVISSQTFKKFTESMAKSMLSGLQVYKTFEVSVSGQKGEIGVIAVWSEKLHQMAYAMTHDSDLPAEAPKKKIIDQIPQAEGILVSTFGVQQKIDEHGNLVLVAYGQAQPVSSSKGSESAALIKAKMNAKSALHSFAGEILATSTILEESESTSEFESGATVYDSSSSFKNLIEIQKNKLNISGIQEIKKWRAKHPLTNKVVMGTIISWSPQSKAFSDRLNSIMTGEGTEEDNIDQKKNENEEDDISYYGQGEKADDDAF